MNLDSFDQEKLKRVFGDIHQDDLPNHCRAQVISIIRNNGQLLDKLIEQDLSTDELQEVRQILGSIDDARRGLMN
jgi:hypothetical protein